MPIKYYKSKIYEKIFVKSLENYMLINCRSKPKFEYDMRDIKIYSGYLGTNIVDNFISIYSFGNHNKKSKRVTTMELKCCDTDSYFVLKPDFSNLPVLCHKFNELIDHLGKSNSWENLSIQIEYGFNYVKYYGTSNLNKIHIRFRSDFESFNDLQKYDFEMIKWNYPEYIGRLEFDGESLRAQKYIIKFIQKPDIGKFNIKLDDRIGEINITDAYEGNKIIITIYYNEETGKYDIYFKPSNIKQFSYLRILGDISWHTGRHKDYVESDILTKIYGI